MTGPDIIEKAETRDVSDREASSSVSQIQGRKEWP